MTVRRGWAAAGLALLLTTGCSSVPSEREARPTAADSTAAVERLLDDDPAEVLARVREAVARSAMRVGITRHDDGFDYAYTLTAAPGGAWRVDTSAGEDGATSTAGDGTASLLAVDSQLCFDHEFRSQVSVHVAESYGVVEFDPAPWTCTEAGFGLNRLASFQFTRDDPRWRFEHLVAGPSAAGVEEVDGEPLLHLVVAGVTEKGPLDPARPAYELWVDGDHLPVRMQTAGMSWEFDYPEDVDGALSAPAADRRGSYGYAVGPGQGAVKACFHHGHCPGRGKPGPRLHWGDGRG